MTNKFEDLRTFVTVAQAGGFTEAARRLGVVKSAVSRRIKDMEERLGVALLNRSTRSFGLTDAGQALYERATSLVAGVEEAETLAARGAGESVGNLRLIAPSTFGRLHLIPLVAEFLEENPRLSVEVSLSDTFVDLLDSGYDMAVRIGELKDSGLVARQLGVVRRVACASPAYLRRFGTPKVPADLERHRGIAYSVVDDKEFWRFVHPERSAAEVVSIGSRLRLDTGDALLAAATAGWGVTVLPTFIIHEAVVSGDVVPLLLPYEKAPTAMHLVYPSRRGVPAKVRALTEFLVARCRSPAYWDRHVFGGTG
ncbi:MAG: hypothetical protein K0R58_163 [Ramlibacter sp.]|jgi:DNA-binding transcriptional LysR family regulator|nr:hypothetical protein [Ramlibacter sp.]